MSAEMKYVAYYRVSTRVQGQSGLGLEAQQKAVTEYLRGGDVIASYTEVESGRKRERPELRKALDECRLHGATLLVAKLDRLARNAHFLLGLKDAGVEFVCCDIPSANRLTIGILAMVAEEEARMISERTKAALAAAKARGVRLGKPENATTEGRKKGVERSRKVRKEQAMEWASLVLPRIRKIQESGITSFNGIARALNSDGVPTRRGKEWRAIQVQRVLGITCLTQ